LFQLFWTGFKAEFFGILLGNMVASVFIAIAV